MLIFVLLVCIMLLVFLASDSQIQSENNVVDGAPQIFPSPSALRPGAPVDFSDLPDDFSFSLSWNIDLPNSYDSAKGILKWGEGCRELILSDEKKRAIREILSSLNVAAFPDAAKSDVCSPGELILTVRCGSAEKTVACSGSTLEDSAVARLAQACYAVIGIITSLDEDSALPA
ncbi:MAG: hypothetical protein GX057_00950 [Clostridiales bacterium]|jgi:hypothetical protein|nr:hypothetical protein [Clostridiales bacterium]